MPSFDRPFWIGTPLVIVLAVLLNELGKYLVPALRRRFPWLPSAVGSRSPSDPKEHSQSPTAPKLQRAPGAWSPSPFIRPRAPPYPNFSLTHTKPLPYRPFRHGPKYNITMGLRRMAWDDWIELDNQYLYFHAQKGKRIRERGEKCSRTAPEAYEGACELLGEVCGYLCERYPGVFERVEDTCGGLKGVKNLATGEEFDICARPLREDPMQIAARLIQDDIALMFERPDGQYYLLAGSILLPGFWKLDDKFGMPLSEIHTSGNVPGFKEKLEKGMMNFFRRLAPEAPVLRNNYFIQVDGELAWSRSIGSEDAVGGTGWNEARKSVVVGEHWLRSERQSLRRLPRTGAIVFTIRTYFHPITSICDEPYVPGRLASAIRSWGDDVSRYKGREKYGDVLLEFLDRRHAEQVKEGLDVSKEEETGKGYPW